MNEEQTDQPLLKPVYRPKSKDKKGGKSLDIVVTEEMYADFKEVQKRRQEPNINSTGRHIIRTYTLMARNIERGSWIKSYIPKERNEAAYNFAKRFMEHFSGTAMLEGKDPGEVEQQLAEFILHWYTEEEKKSGDMDALFDITNSKFPAEIVF